MPTEIHRSVDHRPGFGVPLFLRTELSAILPACRATYMGRGKERYIPRCGEYHGANQNAFSKGQPSDTNEHEMDLWGSPSYNTFAHLLDISLRKVLYSIVNDLVL